MKLGDFAWLLMGLALGLLLLIADRQERRAVERGRAAHLGGQRAQTKD